MNEFFVTCYTLTVVKLKEKIPYTGAYNIQMNCLTVFAILSPVAKQLLHFQSAKPTPLNPPKKLLAGVSPQTHTTAP